MAKRKRRPSPLRRRRPSPLQNRRPRNPQARSMRKRPQRSRRPPKLPRKQRAKPSRKKRQRNRQRKSGAKSFAKTRFLTGRGPLRREWAFVFLVVPKKKRFPGHAGGREKNFLNYQVAEAYSGRAKPGSDQRFRP